MVLLIALKVYAFGTGLRRTSEALLERKQMNLFNGSFESMLRDYYVGEKVTSLFLECKQKKLEGVQMQFFIGSFKSFNAIFTWFSSFSSRSFINYSQLFSSLSPFKPFKHSAIKKQKKFRKPNECSTW